MNNSYPFDKETISKPIVNPGSTIPGRFVAIILFGLAIISLESCGGGGGLLSQLTITPPNSHGAYALGTRRAWSYSSGDTRSEAQRNALASCENRGDDCTVILWFTNQCGALARSEDYRVFRAAVGDTADSAAVNAIGACRAAGGRDCRLAVGTGVASFCQGG